MSDITASIATAIQAKTGGNVEGKIPEWWAEFIGMVLDELHSANRLVPAGGMALTAERVEDVRKLSQMDPWWSAEHVEEVQARVRAMLPVAAHAEPAIQSTGGDCFDVCEGHPEPTDPDRCPEVDYLNHQCSFLPGHGRLHRAHGHKWFAAPAEPAAHVHEQGTHYTKGLTKAGAWTVSTCRTCGAVIERGSEDGAWVESTDPPAPAEPAAEETKAEAWDAGFQAGYDHAQRETIDLRFTVDPPLNPYAESAVPASSPVVPAPTETGPWQRIEDVPEGVLQIKDRHGRTWLMVGGTWRFEWHDGNWHEPHTNVNAQAPFVAAEEG